MEHNILFYGLTEEETQKAIENLLKKSNNVVFYRWPQPFKDLLFENMWEEISKKEISSGDDGKCSDIKQLIAAKEPKVILVENIHLQAHAEQEANDFYRRLLSVCNFYHARHDIFFIFSCIRIPTVLAKENPLIHKWKFVDCNNIFITKFIKQSWEKQFTDLKKIYPEIERYHFYRIKKYIGRRGLKTDSREVRQFIQHLINSSNQFNSEAYLQEPLTEEQLTIGSVEGIKEYLNSKVIGQDEAIQKISDATLLSYLSLRDDPYPRAVFLFVGPSGVGKTKICQEISRILPGYQFLQINMAEYKDSAGVNKIIGLGRGYEDSKAGGILTEPVRLHPRHIILFDEIDHASEEVHQLFYKIFEGKIMDGRGRNISFRDCFIIMTTNKGVVDQNIPWTEKRLQIESKLQEEKNSLFTSAFLGRIHAIIQFDELRPFDLILIAEKYFRERLIEPYLKKGLTIEFTISGCRPELLEKGIFNVNLLFFELFVLMATRDKEQGARRLFNVMDTYIINPLEIYRIKHLKDISNYKINMSFTPFWPDGLNYDQAAILIVDDEEEAKNKLEEIVRSGSAITVIWNNFSVDTIDTEDVSLILLDLYKSDSLYGKEFLNQIADKYKSKNLPVCIYSSLPNGPQLDYIKSSCWQFGISEYISKDDNDDEVRAKIYRLIQQYYVDRKSKIGKPTNMDLELPILADKNSATFNLKWRL